MTSERRLWLGNLCIAIVMFVVAVIPLAQTTTSWILVGSAALIAVGFLLLFPWPISGGQSRRLLGGTSISGNNNRTQTAGDNTNQFMSDGNLNVRGNIETNE